MFNNQVDPDALANLTVQQELATAWRALAAGERQAQTDVRVLATVDDAVKVVRAVAAAREGAMEDGGERGGKRRVQVLVTGSLHLVGGCIAVAGLPV